MVNQWVEFVRKYAKDNNISYGCAVSEASPSYKKYKNNTNIKNMDKSTKKYKKTLKRAELEINAPQSKPIRLKKKRYRHKYFTKRGDSPIQSKAYLR